MWCLSSEFYKWRGESPRIPEKPRRTRWSFSRSYTRCHRGSRSLQVSINEEEEYLNFLWALIILSYFLWPSRDPRQKRLAEKQKQQQNSQLGEVPEKLSFKEKMKMFAMETGEDGTPRDKVKISRAQREIDNIGSPLSPNNNNRS